MISPNAALCQCFAARRLFGRSPRACDGKGRFLCVAENVGYDTHEYLGGCRRAPMFENQRGGRPSFKAVIIELSDIVEPKIHEFVSFWNEARGDAFAPTWKDFDLLKLPPRLIPYVIVADALYDPAGAEVIDFVIRFWGTGQTKWKGADKTGKRTRDAPEYRGAEGWREYLLVVETRAPVASRDTVYRERYGRFVDVEQVQVRVPISDDGTRVTKVATLGIWHSAPE